MAIRAYRWILRMIAAALVVFMAWKSREPLKELFGPAPWINSYDQSAAATIRDRYLERPQSPTVVYEPEARKQPPACESD